MDPEPDLRDYLKPANSRAHKIELNQLKLEKSDYTYALSPDENFRILRETHDKYFNPSITLKGI